MTTLHEIITTADDGGDLTDVTAQVVKALLADHPDIAARLLLPLVRDQVRRVRRARARQAEDRAFAGPAPDPGADPLAALRALRAETFWVPGDGLVTWADATAAQHAARAGYIREHVLAPAAEDIRRHEAAAAVIRAAGAACLAGVAGF
jgi:hypothetical protein